MPRTRPSVAELARQRAAQEIDEIVLAFQLYMEGSQGPWLVHPERIGGRLDAKHLRPWTVAELEPRWTFVGAISEVLDKLVDPVFEPVVLDPNASYTFLRISYEGRAERGETALGKEISYSRIGRARPGDLVVSNISAVYRAICVVPQGAEDLLISNEFTVLRIKPGVDADAVYLWSVLRSSAVIAEWISNSSGVGRHRVDWEFLRHQRVPLLDPAKQREIGALYLAAEQHEVEIRRCKATAAAALAGLELEGDSARDRLIRAKPPK